MNRPLIRVVAVDVDGTLLDSFRGLEPLTVRFWPRVRLVESHPLITPDLLGENEEPSKIMFMTRKADWLTGTNDEGGVAQAIRRLIADGLV